MPIVFRGGFLRQQRQHNIMLTESGLEARLKREIEKRGGMCMKWVSPGTSGVPDRIVFLPGDRKYLVELKSPKYKLSRLSEVQKAIHKKLAGVGSKVWVVKTTDDLFTFLKYIDNEAKRRKNKDICSDG